MRNVLDKLACVCVCVCVCVRQEKESNRDSGERLTVQLNAVGVVQGWNFIRCYAHRIVRHTEQRTTDDRENDLRM
jgi:hypothetical protein